MNSVYIVTADWHLRSQRPRCRLDDNWFDTQKKALDQILRYANEYGAEGVICIGDIFHSTNETTNEIINMVQEFAIELQHIGGTFYILAGNHDLPQHNLDNISRSAFQILLNSINILEIIQLCHTINVGYISAANFGGEDDINADVIFKHILCFPENAKLPPSDKIVKPSELFEQFTNAKYIFTGDYHRQFIFENKKKKQMLLNPGCLIRQAADMIDYDPSVLLVEFNDGELKYKSLPITDDEKMITDEYIENEVMRNNRIEAFIERIKENETVTFDFIENVHNLLKNNKVDENVKNLILELMENT
jgi:DNA repair exonuclease SbcCD nuclease subunit